MLISYKRGQGSVILRVKIRNSSVSTGAGLTGLAYDSSGLIISTIADNEDTATAYTVAAGNVETIATLGTYAAPTAGKCRFKEVDSTNHPGVYEVQLADARLAVSSAKSLLVTISGATNAAECDVLVPLTDVDMYDGTRGGMTALPNAAADAAGGLAVSDAGGLDLDNRMPSSSAVTNLNTVFDTDFATNYNTTRDAWVTNAQDFVGTTAADPFNGQVVAASVTGAIGSVTNLTVQAGTTLASGTHNPQGGDAHSYLTTNLGALGANATEAGGDGDHLTEAGGTGDQFTAIPEVDADVVKISGDATAADNLESQYDGTGLTGDTYPSTQAQVGAIGVASGAGLLFEAEADNTGGAIKSVSFTGVQTSGTYASTEADDGTYHQIDDTGDAIDIVYQFDVGGIRKAIQAVWKGYLVGSNDIITVQAYDYVGSDWEDRLTIAGVVGGTNQTENITLLSKHTGTGADAGKVLLRFVCAGQSNPTLYTDSLLTEATIANQSVGYADGAIWVDTNESNTNTEMFVDGTADNPVSTWAAALTLSASLGIERFHIAGGSSITLTADSSNYDIYGHAYDLDLNGQTITNANIAGARVSGTGVNTGTAPVFEYCGIGAVTLGPSRLYQCGIGRASGAFAAGSAGQFVIIDCFSFVPGSGTPSLDFSGTGSTTGINIRGWKGGTNITLDSDCTLSLEVLAGGGQTVTTGGANVEIRGLCRAVTVTVSDSETVQVIATTGPITINDDGASTATVNLYGVASAVTDNTTGSTVNDYTVKQSVQTGDAFAIVNSGTYGNSALKTLIDDVPTTAEFEARTLVAASYFDPAADKVYLGNGAHGGAAAAITLSDYSDFRATSVTVSDKTGFKLASDGLDLVTAWTADITGTVSGNSTHDAAAVVTALGTGSTLTDCLTATGFSTHSAADVVTALGTGSTLTDCLTATGFSTHSAADVVTALGTGSTLTDCLTATGFSTHSAADVAALILVTPANLLDTDANGQVKLQSNAITAGVIATDAIGASEISAAAVTKIQAGLSTHAAADVVTALGTGSTLTDCLTASGFSTHSAADVVTALGTGSTLTACATATGFSTHSAADVVTALGTGSSLTDLVAPTVAEIRTEMDDNSTISKLLQADVDATSLTQVIYYEKGTSTVLLTQNLFDENGDAIAATTTVVAKKTGV